MGYKLAVNHLADYSAEEIKSMCGYKKLEENKYNGGDSFPYNKNDFQNLPSEIDWRIMGAVTPVKGDYFFKCKLYKFNITILQLQYQ